MDIHERLRFLREQLKLTTRAFGASINMSGGAITNMEKGLRNITNRTIQDICRQYNVNSNWLINGQEPMYEDILNGLDIDDDVKQLAKQYELLNDKDKELVKNMIDSLSEKVVGESSGAGSTRNNDVINVYRAARSTSGKEHGIVSETREEIERLKQLPRVTRKDDL